MMSRSGKVFNTYLTLLLMTIASLLLFVPAASQAQEGEEMKSPVTVTAPDVKGQTHTGSYTYNIPIDVPPGRLDLAPTISLLYNSYNKNSFVGKGWSLDLGSIKRSTKWGLSYGANDFVFSRNGSSSELVARNDWGSNYYGKKIEAEFNRFYKSTSGWTVTLIDGTKQYYGSTDNSRQTNGSSVFKWCLDKIEDTNGNYLTITYFKNQGKIYPDRVDYTGHSSGLAPSNYIQFHYLHDVSDATPKYTTKTQVITSKRIKTIEIVAGTEPVRAYSLDYTVSDTKKYLLGSVSIYGANAIVDPSSGTITSGIPLRTMEFQYSGDATGVFTKLKTDIDRNSQITVGDFNGDGNDDISVKLDAIYMSNGNGYFTRVDKEVDYPIGSPGDFNGDGKADVFAGTSVYISKGNGEFNKRTLPIQYVQSHKTGDFNGDGKTDVICREKKQSGSEINRWAVYLSDDGYDFNLASTIDLPGPTGGPEPKEQSATGDFNGDGITDFMRFEANNMICTEGDGPETCKPAVDGVWHVYLSNTSGQLTETTVITGGSLLDDYGNHPVSGDFNGDGNGDLFICTSAAPSSSDWKVFFSKGDGSFTYMKTMSQSIKWPRSGDFNGDGRDDLIYLTGQADWNCYLSDGKGNFNHAPPELYDDLSEGKPILGDFNGDGKMDFTIPDDHTHRRVFLANNYNKPIPDLLVSINNGNGGTISIEYTPSSRYSNTNLSFVKHTKSTVKVNDGITGENATFYSYSGGVFNRQHREFRGFQTSQATFPDNSVETFWYHQSEYLMGRAYQKELHGEGALLIKNIQTWESEDLSGASRFVKQIQSRTEYYDDQNVYKQIDSTYDNQNGFILSKTLSGTDAEDILYSYEYENFNSTDWVWRKTKETISGSQTGKVRETFYHFENLTGNLLSEEKWLDDDTNPLKQMTYDDYGNLSTITDARNNASEIIYDTDLQTYPVKIILPATNGVNHITEYEYDYRFGKAKAKKDENDHWTYSGFDEFGRRILTEHPDGGKTEKEYHDDVRPKYIKTRILEDNDPEIYIDKYEFYDGFDRKIQTISFGEDNRSIVTKYRFDNMGRQDRVDGPFFSNFIGWPIDTPVDNYYAETTFDYRNRPIRIEKPHGEYGLVSTTYAYSGFSTTITDPDGYKKTEKKDYIGRNIQIIEHADQGLQNMYYTYNAVGDINTITNHIGHVITLNHDTLGQKINMDDPDLGFWQYTYDPNGNMLTQTDAKNQVITFDYDELNRIISKNYLTSDPSVNYTYDDPSVSNGLGRPSSVSNGNVVQTINSYDAMGRQTSVSKTITGNPTTFTTETIYDLSGKVIGTIYPDNYQVNNTFYPGTNLLHTVVGLTDFVSYAECEGYEPTGKMGNIYHGNGTQTTYSYDVKSTRLLSIETKNPDLNLIQKRDYKYSPFGDIKEIYDGVNNITYSNTYDKLHRLIDETNDGPNNNLAPASIEKIYSEAAPIHAVKSVKYNGAEYSYEYDANGNMISGPDFSDPLSVGFRSITYNADNMPESIELSKGGNTLISEMMYDGLNSRAKKTVPGVGATYYISDIFEVKNGVNFKYIFAGNLRVAQVTPTQTVFFHKDHLGSSAVMTDINGENLETSNFMPYGHMRIHTGSVVSDYKFTDQEFDSEIGLYNYDARLYDPVIARFITPDTIVSNPLDPQLYDRYAYCRNNPLTYIDPSGHSIVGSVGELLGPNEEAPRNPGKTTNCDHEFEWRIERSTPSIPSPEEQAVSSDEVFTAVTVAAAFAAVNNASRVARVAQKCYTMAKLYELGKKLLEWAKADLSEDSNTQDDFVPGGAVGWGNGGSSGDYGDDDKKQKKADLFKALWEKKRKDLGYKADGSNTPQKVDQEIMEWAHAQSQKAFNDP